jgi:hypothetical protein
MSSVERCIQTNLGPLTGALPLGNTAPLTTQGVLNLAAFSATTKVIAGSDVSKIRRVKICILTAGVNAAWATVLTGAAAPTVTAAGAGGANEGTLIPGGGGAVEEFSIAGNLDLYLTTSASAVVQISMWEQ